MILTVVLAGDRRLQERLRDIDLLPLDSRLRVRLILDRASRDDLALCLKHALEKAGNPRLLSPGLVETLSDHAGGNHRTLMAHAYEMLLAGIERDLAQLDEQLFFDLFAQPPAERPRARAGRTR